MQRCHPLFDPTRPGPNGAAAPTGPEVLEVEPVSELVAGGAVLEAGEPLPSSVDAADPLELAPALVYETVR